MKIKSELKQLQSHIEEVLYFCEVTKKSKFQTIEVLEILFDHYRSNKVDEFFENDYYEKYIARLEEIRDISYGSSYPSED
jgi:hypothetical protein